MKQAILVVSFGTSYDDTRARTIDAIEARMRASHPGHLVARAFTSGMVINILGKRGIRVPTVAEALAELGEAGVTDVVVQPTHLLYGFEYDKLCRAVLPYVEAFHSLVVGRPLLDITSDLEAVVDILGRRHVLGDDTALVLMGHGTAHHADVVYAALNYMFEDRGFEDVFVGTVEGYPHLEGVMKRLAAGGYTKVLLAPLMLVAGDHATNDMAASDPDSWKSRLEAAGFDVRCVIEGIGEIEAIQDLYLSHVARAMGAAANR